MNGERSQPSVLVLGAGSIGRRHLRNLRALGVRALATCDPARERRALVERELGVRGFASFDEAREAMHPEAVFVCTPPVCHVAQARQAIRDGAHVFIEKPLGTTLAEVDALAREAGADGQVVQVGYNLRFHPGLRRVKELLDGGEIGRVCWARAEFGQYLPDWRPWQHPHESYTAHRASGGGVLLDVSHELDYVLWLLGRPVEVRCLAGRVSALTLDAEDCATVLLRFPDGAQADVHVDCVQRGYSRRCRLAGELGTIEWDYGAREVRVYRAAQDAWTSVTWPAEAEDMYVAEVRTFLACVARGARPPVGVAEGAAALRVALAARAAAEHGTAEHLAW